MKITDLGYTKLRHDIEHYTELKFDSMKYSYLIVKPNGNRHLRTYIAELNRHGYEILGFYAVKDYATLNVVLHPTIPEQRHIIPINTMFKDCYGNYGVLIVIGKPNITYENLVRDVYAFKADTRKIFELNYLSYVFDISNMLGEYREQRLVLLEKDGSEGKKREMNQVGTFLVFSVNSLHSPDPKVDVTVQEMQTLISRNLICENNRIPDDIITKMCEYETFVYLKDI